jgi:hypothetical protein
MAGHFGWLKKLNAKIVPIRTSKNNSSFPTSVDNGLPLRIRLKSIDETMEFRWNDSNGREILLKILNGVKACVELDLAVQ